MNLICAECRSIANMVLDKLDINEAGGLIDFVTGEFLVKNLIRDHIGSRPSGTCVCCKQVEQTNIPFCQK